MANYLRRRDQMVYSIFSKSCPLGHHPFFLSKWFHSERNCLLRRVHYQQSPILSGFSLFKIWKHFHPYFPYFFGTGIDSLFRSINKIHDDKRRLRQVYSFNANADIKVKFTFFKKFIRQWKHSWSKDKQKLHLVDPSS